MPARSRRRFLADLAAGSGAAVLASLGCGTRRGRRRAPPGDPALLDLHDASRAVRSGSLSPVELTRACLERIDRLDRRLNSFITVTADEAMADARRAEGEIANGRWRGPLHGIPIALKDNIDTAGVRTTAASAVFADRVPAEDAEVVQRLRTAGAIMLGKLNLHEFALGTTSAISHYGPVRNPWALDRVAGGSSGGSGAAVAASLCFGAVGTDTGGSIRIPAACCGIVGLRPTHAVVSSRGIVPISTSFDDVGPMCRTVADTALMFRAMTGHPTAQEYDPTAPTPVAGLRVGVLRITAGICDSSVEAEVARAVEVAIGVIRSLVAEVRDAEMPTPDLGRVVGAEGHAFHARHLAETPNLYDPRTRAVITADAGVSAAEYERLRGELKRHRESIGAAFSYVDLVVLPTLPRLPPTIRDATEPFSLDACTFALSVSGVPSISVPCGFSRGGVPIGMLIAGPPLADSRVLALAHAYESATAWHRRRPSL